MWFKKKHLDEVIFKAILLQLEHLEERISPKISYNIDKLDLLQKDLDKVEIWVKTIKNKQHQKCYRLWIENQRNLHDEFRKAHKAISDLPGYPDWMR